MGEELCSLLPRQMRNRLNKISQFGIARQVMYDRADSDKKTHSMSGPFTRGYTGA